MIHVTPIMEQLNGLLYTAQVRQQISLIKTFVRNLI